MAFKTGEMERNTEQLRESIAEKITQSETKLEGVTTKIHQSQAEVDKLAQRQISYSAKIRNIKGNGATAINTLSR